jgi:hypothetical protein
VRKCEPAHTSNEKASTPLLPGLGGADCHRPAGVISEWVDDTERRDADESEPGPQEYPCAGEDWFAIGDARLAHDPLSGRGLILSLHDACNAVDAMSRGYLDGAAAQLRIQTRNELRLYLHERVQVYRLESRFVDHPFWFENQRSVELEVAEANG